MSRGTFDVVLSETARVALPAAYATITMHPDASTFVGTMEELAAVPGVRFEANVGDGGGYAAVDVSFFDFGDDLELTIFVPDDLLSEKENVWHDWSRSKVVAAVEALIPEVSS